MSIFHSLLMQQDTGWKNMPADWSDIRKDCPKNSIALYAAHSQTPQATYTKVGNPTITDNIVSGFDSENYLTVNKTPDIAINNFEYVCTFTTPATAPSSVLTPLMVENGYRNGIGIYTNNGNMYAHGYFSTTAGDFGIFDSSYPMSASTKYTVKVTRNGTTYTLQEYQNDLLVFSKDYEQEGNITYPSPLIFGANIYGNTYFEGSIDFNETYIKINDVYWFRGQPAMTKTLSCVGATGTADLTAEDKDIALNKGWSLTLS